MLPDATRVVIDWLTPALAVPVVGSVPRTRPARFLLVERTGGPSITRVTDSPQITLEAWAGTDDDAAALLREARERVRVMPRRLPGGGICYRVEEAAGPGKLPDPTTAQTRYTMSVVLHLRGPRGA